MKKFSQDDPNVVLLKMNIVLFFQKYLNFWLGSEQPFFECKILHKYENFFIKKLSHISLFGGWGAKFRKKIKFGSFF
jgi:hypothetical protein